MLSAIILSKNEQKNIKQTIDTLSWVDEIIVVDDVSLDATRDIAQRAGAIVYKRDKKGDFASQRNYGLQKAKGDWILFLDADERVPESLKNEIVEVMERKTVVAAYRIPRRDYFWGNHIKYGEVKKVNEKGLLRLMKRDCGSWKGKVHETFETNEEVGILQSYLEHYPHQSVKEFLENINGYSSLRAEELYGKGKKTNWLEIISYPVGKFIYTYFLQQGWKDKTAGFVYSFMMAFHSFLVKSKLYFMQDKG